MTSQIKLRPYALRQEDEQTFGLSEASSHALEFPALLEVLAQLAATDLGQQKVLGLEPTPSRTQLDGRRLQLTEARRLLAGRPLVPSSDQPFGPVLAAISDPNSTIRGRDLVLLADLLEASTNGQERVAQADPPCEALAETVDHLQPADHILRLLRRTFDGRGEIRENATPKLAQLRSRIRGARQQIYEQLSSLIDEHREHLSEETIPMRGGRLVLMLNSGARGRVSGLVHGRSGTGRSFYFEPIAAVDGNNRLQQAVEDEEAEKRRILREVLSTLRSEAETLLHHADWLADLDLLQVAQRFGDLTEGHLADIGERHDLTLLGARHPLLDPRLRQLRRGALGTEGHQGDVVPLDVTLDGEKRALVVTGPNAGGKTVALKTVGLLTTLHHCGFPIPALPGSRLPVLEALVATVGDDQDLLADRSTFSGRLLRLREAWESASPDALMLLDELGSGTDPEEGAALSQALLEGLVTRRALVLVTTHLSQVAATALDTEGAFCAAMEFDPSSGEPTYRLVPGPPGGSEALSLAYRLGLPGAWLDRAESLLGSDHRQLRRLLAEVEGHRQELASTRSKLDLELKDAEKLRERLAQRETELAEEKRRVGKNLKNQLEDFRRQTLERLRREVETIKREMEGGRRKGLASKAAERLFESAPKLPAEPAALQIPIRVGGPVRHRNLGWQGVLEKIEKGKAQVNVGGKLILCKEKDLVGDQPGRPPAKKAAPRKAAASPSYEREAASQLMLVGQRVEPAIDRLDRFLDQALLASSTEVRVVHGHGSGRLREAVRKHLRGHPAVGRHRPGDESEGGDGATVVELRG
ncbi:MAG: Smr/MutS family protein [Acidobacteriota bacterium]